MKKTLIAIMIVFPLLYGCVYVGNSYENEVYEVNNGYSDEELW